jgi:DNA-binding NarL/FixJ family response regulator
MRFVVADRQPSTRSALKLLIEQYPDMEYAGASGDVEGLLELVKSASPDMVLVEWELLGAWPKGSISSIRESSPAVIVVLSCCLDRSVPLDALESSRISAVNSLPSLIQMPLPIR